MVTHNPANLEKCVQYETISYIGLQQIAEPPSCPYISPFVIWLESLEHSEHRLKLLQTASRGPKYIVPAFDSTGIKQ